MKVKKNEISAKSLSQEFNLKLLGNNRIIKNLGWENSKHEEILFFAESERYLNKGLTMKNVSTIITRDELAKKQIEKTDKTILLTKHPSYTFCQIQNHLVEKTNFYGSKIKSTIKSKNIHATACIAEYNVYIGNNVTVGPNVTIMENTHIEDNVRIQAGTIIGVEGNQSVRHQNKLYFIKHGGGVHIEKGVEICSNCVVDKSIFREITIIGECSMIGSFSYVAHNDQIGKRAVLTFKVGLGGTVTIGDDVIIGSGSIIRNGIKIGNNAFISIGSVVTKDVKNNERVSGNFAINHDKFINFIKSIR